MIDKMKLASHVDGPASHLALLKLLLRRGVINDTDLDLYFEIRAEAIKHVGTISSVLAMALLVQQEDADEEEFKEILEEMGIEIEGLEQRCRKALDFMIMTKEQKAQVGIVLDALPLLEQVD